jgi:hypothetical protein
VDNQQNVWKVLSSGDAIANSERGTAIRRGQIQIQLRQVHNALRPEHARSRCQVRTFATKDGTSKGDDGEQGTSDSVAFDRPSQSL